ncbi:hypothetical protein L1987_23849 [Smallanthus sonchifolius]|uniref:Uncharacterized protein n=1 Tax=Smallanthus sonchifolius TaxID=185202 RepID=A0ACB9ILG3_9ASTR|nr:hypothetical protein L1987_23849 [Smallanthus sonchifolius]
MTYYWLFNESKFPITLLREATRLLFSLQLHHRSCIIACFCPSNLYNRRKLAELTLVVADFRWKLEAIH